MSSTDIARCSTIQAGGFLSAGLPALHRLGRTATCIALFPQVCSPSSWTRLPGSLNLFRVQDPLLLRHLLKLFFHQGLPQGSRFSAHHSCSTWASWHPVCSGFRPGTCVSSWAKLKFVGASEMGDGGFKISSKAWREARLLMNFPSLSSQG